MVGWGLPSGNGREDRAFLMVCLCQAQAEPLLWLWLCPRSPGPALAWSTQRPLPENKSISSPGKMSAHVINILRCHLQHSQEKTVNPFTSEYLEAELRRQRPSRLPAHKSRQGSVLSQQTCHLAAKWEKVSANELGIWGKEGGLSEEFPDRGPRILVSMSGLEELRGSRQDTRTKP